MPTAKLRASTILVEFHKAETELTGKAVVLTDGKAGTVEHVWLDELHGLRISVRGHEGKWPVSTIKLAQVDLARTSSIMKPIRAPALYENNPVAFWPARLVSIQNNLPWSPIRWTHIVID
jgi:hypothetical protein